MSDDPSGETRTQVPDEILRGLARPQKELPSKYFYDHRGSELFEEITRLDEYYLTPTEQRLLERWAESWVAAIRPSILVELGAGSARKTRVLLDAMEGRRPGSLFIPVDVSEDFLVATAERLRAEYPELQIEPEASDFTAPLDLYLDDARPVMVALLGSTIGNFDREAAVELLAHVRTVMAEGDAFLLGVDLRPGPKKPPERLERAYDDPAGVTAAFNRNVLRVLNREFGSDFEPGAFEHRAFYDADEGRIEMHLVARRDQVVTFPGQAPVPLRAGESIRTEISCKYDREVVDDLFGRAGLRVREWREDDEGLYALVLAGVA